MGEEHLGVDLTGQSPGIVATPESGKPIALKPRAVHLYICGSTNLPTRMADRGAPAGSATGKHLPSRARGDKNCNQHDADVERARIAIPATPAVHANLAAAYALNGKSERAAAELAEARRLRGEGSYSSIARLTATGEYTVRNIRPLYEATFLAGLRKAGMPEE